jgi:hypothetical protein
LTIYRKLGWKSPGDDDFQIIVIFGARGQLGGGLREDGAGFVVVFDIYYGVARSSSVARGSL